MLEHRGDTVTRQQSCKIKSVLLCPRSAAGLRIPSGSCGPEVTQRWPLSPHQHRHTQPGPEHLHNLRSKVLGGFKYFSISIKIFFCCLQIFFCCLYLLCPCVLRCVGWMLDGRCLGGHATRGWREVEASHPGQSFRCLSSQCPPPRGRMPQLPVFLCHHVKSSQHPGTPSLHCPAFTASPPPPRGRAAQSLEF